MPQRKALKSIAHGLLGTFISRNNDIDGYWGIGVLKLFAKKAKIPVIKIGLLSDAQGVAIGSPVAKCVDIYRKWLRDALQKSGVDTHQLDRAEINLEFTNFEEFPGAVRDTRGEPFLCKVVIVRKNGVTYCASKVGYCETHNARKESRSSRAS